MNTKRGFVPITLILLISLATASSAYVLKSWRWPSPEATFDDSSLSSSWKTAVRNAANEWEDTDEFDWDRSSSSQNKLSLKRLDGSNGTLATTTHERYGDFLYKIGIFFDSSESWHTSSSTPPSSKYDARSVATHEFGHAVGIDHPQNSLCGSSVPKSRRPTMCQHGSASDAKKNDTHRRTLENDDEDAIEDQYDGSNAAPQGFSVTGGRTVCVDFDVASISQADRARSAKWIVNGTITSVGPTLWNANGGAYWDDSNAAAVPLPYHIVTLAPTNIISDDANELTASTSISFAVMRMSPTDTVGCGTTSVGPYHLGDDVVVFLENRQMAWRTGGMRWFLQPVNDPVSGTLFGQGSGIFLDPLSENIDESAVSLVELQRVVHDLRFVEE